MDLDTVDKSQREERLWSVMESTLKEATLEQQRRRRWGIFFKVLTFLYLFILLAMMFELVNPSASKNFLSEDGRILDSYTAVVDIRGTIAADEEANAKQIIAGVRRAFDDKKAKGIILRINSGGGSPVQSGYIYDEIQRLKELHPSKKVYAVISDIGASGAYYIAVAAHEIYADKASLVGSIGVTGASFGFVDGIEKLGIERRLYTSGEHKAFLDPFMPMKIDEVEFWRTVLNGVHEQFISVVREGRGERLKEMEHPKIFSGLIWNGEQALAMGLIDGLGSDHFVAREIIKEPDLVDFSVREDTFGRFIKRLGLEFQSALFAKLHEVTLK